MRWDGTQCTVNQPHELVRCPECGKIFCLVFHWHDHVKGHQE